jgi:hypothetical protein
LKRPQNREDRRWEHSPGIEQQLLRKTLFNEMF